MKRIPLRADDYWLLFVQHDEHGVEWIIRKRIEGGRGFCSIHNGTGRWDNTERGRWNAYRAGLRVARRYDIRPLKTTSPRRPRKGE